jgi:hypothetical protein
MIYYISLDNPHPSGGVKTQYRHVSILNKHGFKASMLHQTRPFRADTWFESDAPVSYITEAEISPGDVLVWPEILASSIKPIHGVKQIIFNQNIHYTWRSQPLQYPKCDGTMTLTPYEENFLKVMNPSERVWVVEHGIDPAIFHYQEEPKDVISFMSRKHANEAQEVFGWLNHHGLLRQFRVVDIQNSNEVETSQILQRSRYFFAFGYPEGGTLPPFEAMACGATVLGYGGFASDDYYRQIYGEFVYRDFLVQSGNTCEFVMKAISVLQRNYVIDPKSLSIRTLVRFPLNTEIDRVTRVFQEVERV